MCTYACMYVCTTVHISPREKLPESQLVPNRGQCPDTWDIPDDLGPHGQFARSAPSRCALTLVLLATKDIDKSRFSPFQKKKEKTERESRVFSIYFCLGNYAKYKIHIIHLSVLEHINVYRKNTTIE